MKTPALRHMLLGVSTSLLVSCGGGGGGGGSGDDGVCGVTAQKKFVLDVAQSWYLFRDELQSANPDSFATTQDYLDALAAQARSEGKDRHFSFVTTKDEFSAFAGMGQAVLYGVTFVRGDQDRVFVGKVESDSPAHEKSFVRGDELLAVGPSGHLTTVGELEMHPEKQADAFGPSKAGVTRDFQVHPFNSAPGHTEIRTLTQRLVTLDLVSTAVIPRQGQTPVGYIAFETFVDPSEQALRNAFQNFKGLGIKDLIVDLRYNGGGSGRIAEVLLNLLNTDLNGQVMYSEQTNFNHGGDSNYNFQRLFSDQPESVSTGRIAFITTFRTASASELVINAIAPYRQVALVGSQTFGKPVGQLIFAMPDCDTLLALISIRAINSVGDTDYYNGLPDAGFTDAACAASDDVTAARGNPAEGSTAAALSWINNNTCPASAKRATVAGVYPGPAQPNLAQRERPGLY